MWFAWNLWQSSIFSPCARRKKHAWNTTWIAPALILLVFVSCAPAPRDTIVPLRRVTHWRLTTWTTMTKSDLSFAAIVNQSPAGITWRNQFPETPNELVSISAGSNQQKEACIISWSHKHMYTSWGSGNANWSIQSSRRQQHTSIQDNVQHSHFNIIGIMHLQASIIKFNDVMSNR